MSAPINFLSDFGTQDEFVGVVHGVIYRLSPASTVIDITHGIAPGDIRSGALALTRAIQYLPPGVVLAVVDPGVGTSRRALALETAMGYFVGPDNGLLSPAVAMVGGATAIHSIENPEVIISGPGSTFHGRDVFAPAAALLASGEASLTDLGPELDPGQVIPLMLALPKIEPPALHGEVYWIDRFGNASTNLGPEDLAAIGASLGDQLALSVGTSGTEARYVITFADVEPGHLALHVDSAGMVALAVRGGRADEELNLVEGTPITLRRS